MRRFGHAALKSGGGTSSQLGAMDLDDILDASAAELAAKLTRVEAQLAALSAEAPERARCALRLTGESLPLLTRCAASQSPGWHARASGFCSSCRTEPLQPPRPTPAPPQR